MAAEVPPYDLPSARVRRCGVAPGIDRAHPALSLALRAIDDAGLPPLRPGTGLVVATASGTLAGPWERWHRAHPSVPTPAAFRRQAVTHLLAAHLGVDGPCCTVSNACASGIVALERARAMLLDAGCPAVVVVGVDALCPFVHAGFDSLGVLATAASRPFEAGPRGFLLGEGAAVLLLERAGGPRPPLTTLLGVGLGHDAAHMAAPHPGSRGLVAAMRQALGARPPGCIELVSPHGTGTRANDPAELAALRRVFGPQVPPLRRAKAVVGHTLGASGVLAVALEVEAARVSRVLPAWSTGSEAVARVPAVSAWMVLASAFGGVHAAAVFGPPEGADPRSLVSVAAGPSARVRQPGATTGAVHHAVKAAVTDVLAHNPTTGPVAAVLTTRDGCPAADRRHHLGVLRSGAARLSRRTFLRTMPGAALDDTVIALGLRGPTLTLLGPAEQGAAAARAQVAEGRAVLAVHVDVAVSSRAVDVVATRFGVSV